MRIIRANDQRAMPWKNGGGVTYEIAAFPEGAGLDSFEWRVSIARVEGDGPFSAFPGIDRSLAIVDGDGITLSVAGQSDMTVRHGMQPASFAADAATTGHLVGGPIHDLNVMTRRSSWAHRMSLHVWDGGNFADHKLHQADVRMVVVRDGSLTLALPQGDTTLAPRDTIIFSGQDFELASARPGMAYFFIDLWRHPTETTSA